MTELSNATILLTVRDIAERLNCSPKTVRRMISRKELEAVRIGPAGRLVRVSEHALSSYCRQNSW